MSKLWAGRFEKEISPSVLDYTQTIEVDTRLIEVDLWGSIAHVIMLCHQNIISQEYGQDILQCLLEILEDAQQGKVHLDKELEDVHLNLESRVISKLGMNIGGRMHTARSRNDQVVTDTRLYLRTALLNIQQELLKFIEELICLAKIHTETVITGYTHSQPAQPISLAYWLTAYASMFNRDIWRLRQAFENTNQNPLGACALAGTSFPIDRKITTQLLGFNSLLLHGLDATSSRDFITESLAAFGITMSNISKMAEEIVLWNSFEFGLIEVDDAFATGSSIMPQKKNPVVAELARARTGRVYGALMHVLTIVKSVTTGYSCDLQEDKPFLWQAIDDTYSTISIMCQQVQTLKFNTQRSLEMCWANFSTATELANYLVVERNMPFREAHKIVGAIVNQLIKSNKNLNDVDYIAQLLDNLGSNIELNLLQDLLDPIKAISRQKSQGGTAPESVQEIVDILNNDFVNHQDFLSKQHQKIDRSFDKTLQITKQFISKGDIHTTFEQIMESLY
ncbi:argininosuccinate lyase [Nostoc foliaceum]|uniref:Argininosuccinate lyase n=1 Tax=Nostoc foliaceum FACHB-393 TaxID=2692915 RepID=A0ABR8IH00_9NOSO|nr:argininosuccinate lyase [Nostoc foliaceum]MBD2650013.1 argininosuccinate lyase [Nostoc foliaceum FACHB-393]